MDARLREKEHNWRISEPANKARIGVSEMGKRKGNIYKSDVRATSKYKSHTDNHLKVKTA